MPRAFCQQLLEQPSLLGCRLRCRQSFRGQVQSSGSLAAECLGLLVLQDVCRTAELCCQVEEVRGRGQAARHQGRCEGDRTF